MRYFFIYSILFLSFTSCIYNPSKENFVEIEKDVPVLEITDKNVDLEADTLYVWKYTRFNYDLSGGNAKIHSTQVIFLNDTLRYVSGQGSFVVNPSSVNEGTYKVKILVYSGSGTGSLADKLGGEGYEFNRELILVVAKPKIVDVKINSTIENGFLKFSWDKIDKRFFKSYRLYIHDSGINNVMTREITDVNRNSFIDSSYVGGSIALNLWVNYINSDGYDAIFQKSFNYDYPIKIRFKEGIDSLRISWDKNPFHCSVHPQNNGNEIFNVRSDTMATIRAPGLGGLVQYGVTFKPTYLPPFTSGGFNTYATFTAGIFDGFKHSNIEYSQLLHSYIFKHEMSFTATNELLDVKGKYDYSWDYSDNNTIDFSVSGDKIYTTVNGQLNTFNSKLELLNSEKLPVGEIGFNTIRVIKSLDDRVFLIGTDGVIFLYDIVDHRIISRTPTVYGVSSNFKFAVSADGNYVAFINDKLYVYEIRNKQELILRHQIAGSFYGCFFAPNDPNKLILNTPENIRIFNCSSGSVDRVIDRFYANPINIDPVTNYMLLVSNSKAKIYIYDYESDKLVLELNHHGFAYDFKLLNNLIFTNPGYHFDISPYVYK